MLRQERHRQASGERDARAPRTQTDWAAYLRSHPGVLESLVPVWGAAREAVADGLEGNSAQAALNAGLAATDVFLVKALAAGLARGGLRLSGPFVWRTKPWEEQQGMRQWMGERGFLKPGQPGHHWLFKQRSRVPEFIKNQPPFVHGVKDASTHGRIHGQYTVDGVKMPRFTPALRFQHGTPPWAKATVVSGPGHVATAAEAAQRDR